MVKKLPVSPADSIFLKFLYRTIPGRVILAGLSAPSVSKWVGTFMDSPVSKCLIPSFIKKYRINMNQYEKSDYHCFNDFFTRKIRFRMRPIDQNSTHFIAPCDGFLKVFPIRDGMVYSVKQSFYTIASLLRNKTLAEKFAGGTCLIFRLCVDNYHRYCYPVSGLKSDNVFLKGVLHTVRPTALENCSVFTENSREYTLIKTQDFGTVLQMEVGAMLVGKIQNLHTKTEVYRGWEKGLFLYGGSTVIVLLQKDKISIPEEYYEATEAGLEIPVKMGEMIGKKYSKR